MAFGIGDELSVKISARTGDFERSMEAAQRSLTGLSGDAFTTSAALQVLASRADEAGDEIEDTGRESVTTSAKLVALSGASDLTTLSFLSLKSTVLLGVLPALAALSATLVPITATFGGLAAAAGAVAGAFGAVVGSGLIAFGQERAEQNKENLQQVRARIEALKTLEDTEAGLNDEQQKQLRTLEEQEDKLEDATSAGGALELAFANLRRELVPIIAEFGQRFVPLIRDGLNAVPGLTRSILNSLGPLDSFVQAIRSFGRTAQNQLPNAVARLADLARNALPAVIDAGQWLINNGPRIFEGIIRTTRDVGPILQRFGQFFVDIIPAVNRFGRRLLNDLVPAGRELIPELVAIGQILSDLFDEETINGITTLVDGFLDLVIVALKLVEVLSNAFSLITGISNTFGGVGEAGGEAGVADIPGGTTAEQIDTNIQQRTQRQQELQSSFSPNVNVNIQGDSRFVEDVAVETVQQQSRQADSNTGGPRLP